MCQLIGISSNKKVNIQFSLLEFKNRSKDNPHGWGFSFKENDNWTTYKKPDALYYENIEEKKFNHRSNLIIGHIRRKSCGKQIHENTHPFICDNWVFAHNGTVREIINRPEFAVKKSKTSGQTDSEYAFHYLLEKINNKPKIIAEILIREAHKIKEFGKFNFLLSDGNYLFSYGDDSLYFVQRKAPFSFATLRDVGYSFDLNDIKSPEEKVIIVATEPLTLEEHWEKIIGLRIFKDGVQVK